jgi:DNA-binding MarR family transcriptional regulator
MRRLGVLRKLRFMGGYGREDKTFGCSLANSFSLQQWQTMLSIGYDSAVTALLRGFVDLAQHLQTDKQAMASIEQDEALRTIDGEGSTC